MGRKRSEAWYKKRDKFLETPGVKEKLLAIATKHEFSVDELVDLIGYESTFNTQAKNKSGATGLIQFMPKTAKGLGTTTGKIAKMSTLEQLDYVSTYFDRNHTKGSHPYVTVAYPSAARKGANSIIADGKSKIAKQNPGWVDSNGNVTRAAIENFVKPNGVTKFKAAYNQDENSSEYNTKWTLEGDLSSDYNINKVLSEIDTSEATLDKPARESIKKEVGKSLSGVVDNSVSPIALTARFAINGYKGKELVREFKPNQEMQNSLNVASKYTGAGLLTNEYAQGGDLQPNGRVTTFTRPEDIKAQGNTYEPMNMFIEGGDLNSTTTKSNSIKSNNIKPSLTVFTYNPKRTLPEPVIDYDVLDGVEARQDSQLRLLDETGIVSKDNYDWSEAFLDPTSFGNKDKQAEHIVDKSSKEADTYVNNLSEITTIDDTFHKEYNRSGEDVLSRNFTPEEIQVNDPNVLLKILEDRKRAGLDNSNIMLMDHSGDSLFGTEVGELGRGLAELGVDNCYTGSCHGERMAISGEDYGEGLTEHNSSTNFYVSKGEDRWEGFNSGKKGKDAIFPKGYKIIRDGKEVEETNSYWK